MQRRVSKPNAEPTDSQLKFLLSLIQERTEFDPAIIELWRDAGVLTRGFVSARIEEYKKAPKIERPSALPAPTIERVEPGYYVTGLPSEGREFWVVVESKANPGRTYAKLLVRNPPDSRKQFDWVYTKGAVARFVGQTPLTIEEAAEWGRLHGRCLICHRQLTTVSSVKAGIGPTCKKQLLATKSTGKE